MLQVRNLFSGYGGTPVLHDVSLDVPKHSIVSIIGANGAGKSTLLNTLAGLIRIRKGSFVYDGVELTGMGAETIVRYGMTLVPERRQLFDMMTVEENLLLGAHSRRDHTQIQKDISLQFSLFPVLGERRRQLARSLSGGEQQMLAIARANMSRPRLIMMDEPSLGLAPLMVEKIYELIVHLRESGTTILLVEQNARAALLMSDAGCVMESGRIRLSGTSQELLNDTRVRDVYLGGSREGQDNLEGRIRAKAQKAKSSQLHKQVTPPTGSA